MTPKQRSDRLRIAGYTETADCMDKMISVLEELANVKDDVYIPSWLIDDAKDALK